MAALIVLLVVGAVAPAGAAGGSADLAVDVTVIDDTTDPQVARVRMTNHGPADSAFPIAAIELDGATITGHDGDPQPGTRADGVGCELDPRGAWLSCSWDVIAAGTAQVVDVEVDVDGPATLSVQAEPAGTPDPNPTANNTASTALSPAVADLAITDVEVRLPDGRSGGAADLAAARHVEVAVTIAHREGREGSVVLDVDADRPVDLSAACDGSSHAWTCAAGVLAPGRQTVVVLDLDRPEPDAPAVHLDLVATPVGLGDPDPDAATAEVVLRPRTRVPGEVRRHAGAERIATAIAISGARFTPDGADAVVLARADVAADALAGGSLAVEVDGPILLTPPGQLAVATAAEIDRVLPQGGTVHLLGGTAAISDDVAQTIARAGYRVERIAGPNRYGTAVEVWEALGRPRVIAAADGDSHADAVIAGAAMAASEGALLLTSGDRVPAELAPLAGQVDWAVGGRAAAALPGATGLHGATPAATGVAVARAFFAAPDAVGLATAGAFPDALAGGPLTAGVGGPLLLTDGGRLSREVAFYLQDTPTIVSAHLLGGTAALSAEVEQQVTELIAR